MFTRLSASSRKLLSVASRQRHGGLTTHVSACRARVATTTAVAGVVPLPTNGQHAPRAVPLRRHIHTARFLCSAVPDTGFFGDQDSFGAVAGLHPELVRRLAGAGFTRPSRVQSQALPALLAGEDAVVSAETGSGKTLAYLLPIFQRIFDTMPIVDGKLTPHGGFPPAGLVIVPSVDLVKQVAGIAAEIIPELVADGGVFMVHGRFGPTRHDRIAIMVATPKALLENVRFKLLQGLRVVVVDEADILISGTLLGPLQDFLARMKLKDPSLRPQHVFAAATVPDRGKKSVQRWLDKYYATATSITTPLLHRVNPRVRQVFVRLPSCDLGDAATFGPPLDPEEAAVYEARLAERESYRQRVLLQALEHRLPGVAVTPDADDSGAAAGPPVVMSANESLSVLDDRDVGHAAALAPRRLHVPSRTLVFVSSVARAKEVMRVLQSVDPELPVATLHKGVDIQEREEVLNGLRSGAVQVLVCTDLGSRGLDYDVRVGG